MWTINKKTQQPTNQKENNKTRRIDEQEKLNKRGNQKQAKDKGEFAINEKCVRNSINKRQINILTYFFLTAHRDRNER